MTEIAGHSDNSWSASITVIGAGAVGTHLLDAFGRAGHQVRLAARDPHSNKVSAAVERFGSDVVDLATAADGAEFIVLAVPFSAVTETLRAVGETGDSVLIDATNVVDGSLPHGASTVVDVITAAAPDAVVVKAFNTIGAEAFTAPSIDDRPLFLPIAGDRPAADDVQRVAASIGFDAIVIGDRSAARILENFAELWIHLAFRTGLGRDFGFVRLERPKPQTEP